jgi:hypothetical protein
MLPSRDPEPLAVELADLLPRLEHPRTGTVLVFAGLGSQGMAPRRLETAEAILHWLRLNGHMPPLAKPKVKRVKS